MPGGHTRVIEWHFLAPYDMAWPANMSTVPTERYTVPTLCGGWPGLGRSAAPSVDGAVRAGGGGGVRRRGLRGRWLGSRVQRPRVDAGLAAPTWFRSQREKCTVPTFARSVLSPPSPEVYCPHLRHLREKRTIPTFRRRRAEERRRARTPSRHRGRSRPRGSGDSTLPEAETVDSNGPGPACAVPSALGPFGPFGGGVRGPIRPIRPMPPQSDPSANHRGILSPSSHANHRGILSPSSRVIEWHFLAPYDMAWPANMSTVPTERYTVPTLCGGWPGLGRSAAPSVDGAVRAGGGCVRRRGLRGRWLGSRVQRPRVDAGLAAPTWFRSQREKCTVPTFALWEAPQRYIDNSPVFHLNRVNTPLLLLHGTADDACPIHQAEEMYAGLLRLGKVATLVRYHGAGHVIGQSPENHIDMQVRVLEWFDTYLRGETEEG